MTLTGDDIIIIVLLIILLAQQTRTRSASPGRHGEADPPLPGHLRGGGGGDD